MVNRVGVIDFSDVEDLALLEFAAQHMRTHEWAGLAQLQGNGPHSSGGPAVAAACLECGGKNPNDPRAAGHFRGDAYGHRDWCPVARFLAEFDHRYPPITERDEDFAAEMAGLADD